MMISLEQAILALEATEKLRFHLNELIALRKRYDSCTSVAEASTPDTGVTAVQPRAFRQPLRSSRLPTRQTLQSRPCRFYKSNFELT